LPVDTSAIYIFYLAREYDRAVEECRKALDLDPNFARAHANCGLAYEAKSMYREAVTEFEKALTVSGTQATYAGLLGHALAVSGEKGKALKVLDGLREGSKQTYVPAYDMAVIYVGLGEKDQAFRWLQNAYEERSSWLPLVAVNPVFDGLRSDPRFQDLLRRMNFPL
jgi:tetratricopeptide (TPR) repeat protein